MFVVKRDGRKEPIMFDKITARIRKLNYGLNPLVDPVRVAMRVIEGLYDGVTTSELDNLAAEIAEVADEFNVSYKRGGITALEVIFALAQGLNLDDVELAYVMLNSNF